MALADEPEQYKAMATIFDDLKQRHDKLIAEITAAEAEVSRETDVEAEIDRTIGLVAKLNYYWNSLTIRQVGKALLQF